MSTDLGSNDSRWLWTSGWGSLFTDHLSEGSLGPGHSQREVQVLALLGSWTPRQRTCEHWATTDLIQCRHVMFIIINGDCDSNINTVSDTIIKWCTTKGHKNGATLMTGELPHPPPQFHKHNACLAYARDANWHRYAQVLILYYQAVSDSPDGATSNSKMSKLTYYRLVQYSLHWQMPVYI